MDPQLITPMPWIVVLVTAHLVLGAVCILDLITSKSSWVYRLLWISIIAIFALVGAVAYLIFERRHVIARLQSLATLVQSWRVGH